ncbi:hypothetical protein DPMN_012226 [Dreissena polymorpha]|uniref:Uncharacterized protein n=1 Tax=Dreissena polymorpha TaxID=45954 RepID=A0A9D4S144_DREPO|nr:hypothetical protein DPMN_012226 [Dreissena polymorpha]
MILKIILYLCISVKNEDPCPQCFAKYKQVQWDTMHPPAPVERNITNAGTTAYKNPVPPFL